MENRLLHLVWCDRDFEDPVFFGAFASRKEASEYVKSFDSNKIHSMGLHPSNFRISIITYFSRKTDSMTVE
jgi:hypothetical protein